ncbi:LuxR C-terminal-related transcriptional regulator [Cohnella zeiphila]|uniref:HTH luxR-type domain-containing protein n=1 Tax=Cohnella zeiphila TaxID=2761120 RepID=A0A7X0VW86_9BACL|nr:hypothetical protein [Cohnella zeiphila]
MIISTKIQVPYVNTPLVQRQALIQRLHKGIKGKLTLVVAPAGYGKSTLLSEWAKSCETPVAWVSLDARDNDFERFWTYAIASVDQSYPSFGASLPQHLKNIQPDDYDAFLSALLGEFTGLPGHLILVLDDFHTIDLPSINDALAYMLDYLPASVHIVVASRHQPDLPTARLLARGELYKLALDDLRFQAEEGIRFFQTCMELPLPREDAALLVELTEGWVSGLQMAGISMRASSRPSDFIQRFKGRQRDIANYLLEEVFGRQPGQVRSFLMKTSVLNRMNESLCQAVMDLRDCQDQLKRLENKQLFVIPLDEHGEWYRYHHLFADFLQQQLRLNDPEQWEQAHERAAKWFEAHGWIEEAVEHFLAGQQSSEVIRIVENQLPLLLQLNRSVLYRWMTMLPESLIADNPKIEIFYFSVLIVIGQWHLAKSRIMKIQDKLSEEKWQPFAGHVYLAFANFAIIQKDAAQTSAYLEQFDKEMPDGNDYQMMGGNTAQGSDYDHFLSHFNDLQEAEAFLIRWIEAWENKINYPFVGYFFASYSELLYERNLLEEAKSFAERAMERQDMRPYARIMVRAAISLSQVEQAEGRLDKAFEHIENAKSMIDSPDRAVFDLKLEAHLVSSKLARAASGDIGDWARTCGLKPADAVPFYRIPEYIALARVLEHDHQPDQAEFLLDKLFRLTHKENRLRDKIKVLVKWSMMEHRRGNTEAAIEKLSVALQLAEPNGYVRSFADEGAGMAELLTRYLHMRQHRFIRESNPASLLYIKKLLSVLPDTVEGPTAPSVMLTGQQLNILRLIAKGLTNKQIAEQCFVTSETVKTHIKHIYMKLDVNNRFHAIRRAKELRLL